MKTEPPAGAATNSPITLSTNCVIEGKFFAAGEPIPFANEAAVPASLKPFITEPAEPESTGPPGGVFQPDIVYRTDDTGAILSRGGRRQAAQLAHAVAAQEARAAGTLDPETEALLRGEHEYHISGQILTAEIKARNADAAIEAAPTKPPAFFVKRGALFMRTTKAKLRAGEEIFTRQPNGQWRVAGIVDASGSLPE